MESPEYIRDALACQICSENYWRVFPDNDTFVITDGVKIMAEMCGAFWLVTAVFSWQSKKKVEREPFQVWTLAMDSGVGTDSAVLICEDGNSKELARQVIEYTDFPLPEGIKLFLEGGVLLLPSEH
jgi:hypothetical protein